MKRSLRLPSCGRCLAVGLATLMAVWPALPLAARTPGEAPAVPERRALADGEMAAVVGAAGTLFKGDIAYEQEREEAIADGQTLVFDLDNSNPENLNMVSVRVEDAGAPVGSYSITLNVRGDEGNPFETIPAPPAGEPTIALDVELPDDSVPNADDIEIRVKEEAGSARNMRITISPRYRQPVNPVSLGGSSGVVSLLPGEIHAYAFTVAPGEEGEIDIFFDDQTIAPGRNVVTLLDPDHTLVKVRTSNSGDVSLDNSDFENLVIEEDGTYLVLVTNDDAAGTGTYELHVGPAPSACLPFGPPLLDPDPVTGEAEVPGELTPVGDRDCYQFVLPHGIPDLKVILDEDTTNGTTPGTNEVRVYKDGVFVKSLRNGTDISGRAPVDGEGGELYQFVVNNKANGEPEYTLKVRLDGACVGTGCALSPEGDVAIDLGPSDDGTRPIRMSQDPNDVLRLDAAASFQLDKKSAGTWTLEVRGTVGSVDSQLCIGSGSSDFFVENCDLATDDGKPYIQVSNTGSGTDAVVRMGVELAQKLDDAGSIGDQPGDDGDFGQPIMGELVGIGDEDYLDFHAPAGAEIGIGFDDQGISGTNQVCIYRASQDFERDPGEPPVIPCFESTGDGSTLAKVLDAGVADDYVLVIDNDKLGDGEYTVCIGPKPGEAEEANDGQDIPLPDDLGPSSPAPGLASNMSCGDSDTFTITNTPLQKVKIEVRETSTGEVAKGNIAITLSASGVPTISKSGRNVARIFTQLLASTVYTLTVDNGKLGSPGYQITITDDD